MHLALDLSLGAIRRRVAAGGGGASQTVPVGIKTGSVIVANGTGGDWDTSIREIGNVIYDPTDTGEEYKLVYSGHTGSYVQTDVHVGYAHSSDGVNWTKGGQLTLGRAAEDPYVVKSGATYYLYVEDKEDDPFRNIRLYTSTDFSTWVDQGDVLDIGTGWEERWVASPHVWIEGATWHMLYEGSSLATGAPGAIGHATSSDGIAWTKDAANNPVLEPSDISWSSSIVPNDIKKIDGTYVLLSHGERGAAGDGDWRPFVATSTDLITWAGFDEYLGGLFDSDSSVLFHPATDTYVYNRDNDIYQATAATYGTAVMAETRAALRTTTGRQQVTIAGFGMPKAALVTLTRATADGTPAVHANGSFGVAAKTSQWAASFASDDGSANSSTRTRWSTTTIADMISGGTGGTHFVSAKFINFIEDGIDIDVTLTPAVAYFLTVTLFGTDPLEVYTATRLLPNATTEAVTTGFETKAALFVTPGRATAGTNTDVGMALGMMSWNGAALGQTAYAYRSVNAQATMDVQGVVRNDAVAVSAHAADFSVSAADVTATDFDLTTNDNFSGSAVGILALGGIDAWVGVVDSPITTGNADLGSAAFTPTGAIMLPNMLSSVNAINSAGEGGAFGISTIDGTREHCNSWADEDASASSDTQSVSDDQAINLDAHDGSAAFDATFGSWQSGAVRLNFTAANGTARKWPVMLLKAGS